MNTPIPQQKPVYVDPAFSPPRGFKGFEFIEISPVDEVNETNDTSDGSSNSGDGSLDAPDGLSVFSQKLIQGTGRTQLVDVVIQCNDVQGAKSYNIKVAKE